MNATIKCCNFSKNNKMITVGCTDNSCYIYDIFGELLVNSFHRNGWILTCIFGNIYDYLLIAGIDKKIVIYNYVTSDIKYEFNNFSTVNSCCFNNNDSKIIAACSDNKA